MTRKRSQADVVDLGKIKVHMTSGFVGRVIGEVYPGNSDFGQYRLVLEDGAGLQKEFIFMELRDATGREEGRFRAGGGKAC